MKTQLYAWLYPKLRPFYATYRHKDAFHLLDVGCGIHSPTKAKRVFPQAIYHGIDRDVYENTADDMALIDQFFQLNLDHDSLDEVPDNFYDVIIMAHVIEHLWNGLEVVETLCQKLKQGGSIYMEYPSARSLHLPSANGTLNFWDDPTHMRLYETREILPVLEKAGMVINKTAVRHDPFRILAFPVALTYGLLKRKPATAFWDILGFAEYIYAVKR